MGKKLPPSSWNLYMKFLSIISAQSKHPPKQWMPVITSSLLSSEERAWDLLPDKLERLQLKRGYTLLLSMNPTCHTGESSQIQHDNNVLCNKNESTKSNKLSSTIIEGQEENIGDKVVKS